MANNKSIKLNKTVYELSKEFPELPNLLAEIGFQDITKPGMLATAGRFMTIPKGASMKKIDMEIIMKSLIDNGYEIEE